MIESEKEDMLRLDGYAPWVTAGEDVPEEAAQFNTLHLPEEVVGNLFTLLLDARTVEGQPRAGGYWVSLRYGMDSTNYLDNPKDLTDDDKEYILEAVRFALDNLVNSHEDEKEEE